MIDAHAQYISEVLPFIHSLHVIAWLSVSVALNWILSLPAGHLIWQFPFLFFFTNSFGYGNVLKRLLLTLLVRLLNVSASAGITPRSHMNLMPLKGVFHRLLRKILKPHGKDKAAVKTKLNSCISLTSYGQQEVLHYSSQWHRQISSLSQPVKTRLIMN